MRTPAVRLVSVYSDPEAVGVLYRLLSERGPSINISHRAMPSVARHRAFVRSRPYKAWYLVRDADTGICAGSVYLSKADEIGLFIFRSLQGRGYGPVALKELMKRHRSKRYLANINPANTASIRFFSRMGFRHIQNTYELRKSSKGGRK